MEITPWMVIGFLLAAYSVTANDSLQTLGSYLSSNEHRTPKRVQMVFLCTLTASVMMMGWFINNGEPAWGRLTAFPQPDCLTWAYLIPPIAVLVLTAWGAPVSTSFLVLSAFVPGTIGTLVAQSVLGYLFALSLGLAVWGLGLTLLERLLKPNHQASANSNNVWYFLQWCSTGSLWGLWLVQDLANIFIFLPRNIGLIPMLLCTTALCSGLCALVAIGGGPIQGLLRSKTNASDLRSATVIDLMFAICLLVQTQLSSFPLSTTWVFLGLLGGREIALTLRQRSTENAAANTAENDSSTNAMGRLSKNLSQDIWKAGVGLIVSLTIALGIQPLISLTTS
jgi:hypothetical protein